MTVAGIVTVPAVGWLFAFALWVAAAASLAGLGRAPDDRPDAPHRLLVTRCSCCW